MKLVVRLLVSAVAILVTAYIIPGVVVDSFVTAVIVAVVLGALNVFVRPLLEFLTLPITVLTLGLFQFVIIAALVWGAAYLVAGFSVSSLWTALFFGIVSSLISSVLSKFTD